MRVPSSTFLGLLLLSTACAKEPSRPDVVIVTLDAVRADVTPGFGGDPKLAPNLAHWIQTGTRFDRAYTVAPLTLPAHSTLLSGLYPVRHGARRHGVGAHMARPLGFVAAARAAGWVTGAFPSSKVIAAANNSLPDFDFVDMKWSGIERQADKTVVQAARWLHRQPRDTPVLLWAHLFEAHAPYTPTHPWWRRCPPDLREEALAWGRRTPSGCPDPNRPGSIPSAELLPCVRELYESQLKDLDGAVAALFKVMAGRGRFVWAIAADHGECLGEEGYVAQHGGILLECAVHIPLALGGAAAFKPGVVRSDLVSLVDLAPTLASLLGWSLDVVDGIDLARRQRSAEEAIGFEAAGVNVTGCTESSLGVWRGSEKIVYYPATDKTRAWRRAGQGSVEIDPAALSEEGRTLARELRYEPPLAPPQGRHEQPVVADPAAEALKALGYVE